MHVGRPRLIRDPMSRKIEYMGPCVNIAARITALTHGGQVCFTKPKGLFTITNLADIVDRVQILLSNEAVQKIDNEILKEKQKFVCLGKFELPDLLMVRAHDDETTIVFFVRLFGLKLRINLSMPIPHTQDPNYLNSK